MPINTFEVIIPRDLAINRLEAYGKEAFPNANLEKWFLSLRTLSNHRIAYAVWNFCYKKSEKGFIKITGGDFPDGMACGQILANLSVEHKQNKENIISPPKKEPSCPLSRPVNSLQQHSANNTNSSNP
jgi:hypothetical protein